MGGGANDQSGRLLIINKGRVANGVNFQMLCLVSFTHLKSIIRPAWPLRIIPPSKRFTKSLQKLGWRRPRNVTVVPSVLGARHPAVKMLLTVPALEFPAHFSNLLACRGKPLSPRTSVFSD